MELLTIGAFARAARLSPKALRLYDDLGLLRPARVDPATGYRFYAPAQLGRARLVAWLRRLGMPLQLIHHVCDLDPSEAAREVRAHWARVEADTAARRDLAGFLIDHLSRSGRDTPMTTALTLRYSARSDAGLVRTGNQDTAYADARLLAVADGFGPAGAPAGAAAIDALKRLETGGIPAGDILNVLQDAVESAGHAVAVAASGGGAPTDTGAGDEAGTTEEAGTTLTAMLWTGTHLALVHIGDSRAYLLRDGGLFLITHDHTLVQSMVDEGRLAPEEAASHPQRTLLLRALTSGATPAADLRLHDAVPGDRYLLCSDGLSAVVPDDAVRHVLATAPDPDDATRALIALANDAGGPDNISCVVADVVPAHAV